MKYSFAWCWSKKQFLPWLPHQSSSLGKDRPTFSEIWSLTSKRGVDDFSLCDMSIQFAVCIWPCNLSRCSRQHCRWSWHDTPTLTLTKIVFHSTFVETRALSVNRHETESSFEDAFIVDKSDTQAKAINDNYCSGTDLTRPCRSSQTPHVRHT